MFFSCAFVPPPHFGKGSPTHGLTVVEEVRRCMFEALDRYKFKGEKIQRNYLVE